MADVLESLLVKLAMDASDYDRELKHATDSTESFSKKSTSAWGGFTAGIGIQVADMAANAVASFGAMAVESLNMASDLGETTSKVQTLFGDSAGAIMTWAEEADTAFGLSKAAALDAVGGLGNMFLQIGAGTDQASELSQSMVGMAADLASFHNAAGGTNEVLDTMTAAFRGEYDSVQRFIPTINAANVEMKALEMTGKASAKELTALEKALAVQAILMQDAGAATGDFARTSEGMANQTRIMQAQFENIQTSLGQIFIPLVTQALQLFNSWVPAISAVAESFVGWIQSIESIEHFFKVYEDGSGILTDLLVVFGMTEEAAQNVGVIFYDLKGLFNTFLGPVVQFIDSFVSMQDVLVAVGVVIASVVVPALVSMVVAALPIIATFAAIVAAVALLRKAWETDFLGIRTHLEAFGKWISDNWVKWVYDLQDAWNEFLSWWSSESPTIIGNVRSAFEGFTKWLGDAWQTLVNLLTSLWRTFTAFWPQESGSVIAEQRTRFAGFSSWLGGVWDGLTTHLKTGWQDFSRWWQSDSNQAANAVEGFWQDHSDEVTAIASNQWETIKTLFETALSLIGGFLLAGLQFITGDWQGGMETLGSTASGAWENIQSIFDNQLDSLKQLFEIFGWGEIGENIVQGIADGISAGAHWISDAAQNAAQSALDAAKNLLGIGSPSKVAAAEVGVPFSEGIGVGVRRGLGDIAARIDAGLTGLFDNLQGAPAAVAPAAGGGMTLNIYLSGSATYEDGRAVAAGVDDELRARGLR